MMKPKTMCDEIGCTRDWTIKLIQTGHPVNASMGSTAMEKKVCDPCADAHKRVRGRK